MHITLRPLSIPDTIATLWNCYVYFYHQKQNAYCTIRWLTAQLSVGLTGMLSEVSPAATHVFLYGGSHQSSAPYKHVILTSLTEGACQHAQRNALCTEGSMRHSCNYMETEGRLCKVRKRETGRERVKETDRERAGTHVGDQLCVLLWVTRCPALFVLHRQRGR